MKDYEYSAPIDTVRVIQVIESTICRRGEGANEDDPVRVIPQYFTLDGRLIFEIDKWKEAKNERTN